MARRVASMVFKRVGVRGKEFYQGALRRVVPVWHLLQLVDSSSVGSGHLTHFYRLEHIGSVKTAGMSPLDFEGLDGSVLQGQIPSECFLLQLGFSIESLEVLRWTWKDRYEDDFREMVRLDIKCSHTQNHLFGEVSIAKLWEPTCPTQWNRSFTSTFPLQFSLKVLNKRKSCF